MHIVCVPMAGFAFVSTELCHKNCQLTFCKAGSAQHSINTDSQFSPVEQHVLLLFEFYL